VASRGAARATSPPAPTPLPGRSKPSSAPPALAAGGLLPEADASRRVYVRGSYQVSLCTSIRCGKERGQQRTLSNPHSPPVVEVDSSAMCDTPFWISGPRLPVPTPVIRCEAR
jgi:hypothetical protein